MATPPGDLYRPQWLSWALASRLDLYLRSLVCLSLWTLPTAMSEKKIVGILPNNYVHVLDLVSWFLIVDAQNFNTHNLCNEAWKVWML